MLVQVHVSAPEEQSSSDSAGSLWTCRVELHVERRVSAFETVGKDPLSAIVGALGTLRTKLESLLELSADDAVIWHVGNQAAAMPHDVWEFGNVDACSFCDCDRSDVDHLLPGPRTKPGLSICDRCVAYAQRVLALKSEGGHASVGAMFEPIPHHVQRLAQMHGVAVLAMSTVKLDAETVRLLPREIAERYGVVLLGKRDELVSVVMTDPGDADAIAEIEAATGCRVETRRVADPLRIEQAIKRFYA